MIGCRGAQIFLRREDLEQKGEPLGHVWGIVVWVICFAGPLRIRITLFSFLFPWYLYLVQRQVQ